MRFTKNPEGEEYSKKEEGFEVTRISVLPCPRRIEINLERIEKPSMPFNLIDPLRIFTAPEAFPEDRF